MTIRKTLRATFTFVAACLLATACGKSEEAAKPTDNTPQAAAPQQPAPAAVAAPVEPAEVEVITPEDFEDEAEQEVTAKNLEDELKELEDALQEEG